ncbi:hypothetical protein [Indioceanicola profundi]|uniref:hypothetical protein n=1 Tax=Indioceanicola profundi TaxID=2220096 RepID=UPI000E6ABE0B|nr:hypothetical protein [Indioceanicola profundi]
MGFFDTILLSALFAGAAFLLALLIGRFAEARIAGLPQIKAAEEVIPLRARMEAQFDLRSTGLKQEIARLSSEMTTLRRQRFSLEKMLLDTRREAESPIRVVGREGSTPVCFRAWMINRQVQAAVVDGKQHPSLDKSWASPQVVEVWADNLGEARREVQRIYPPPLGFTILNLRLDSSDGQEV